MNARLYLALMLFAPLAGCGGDDVTSYNAPRDDDPGTGSVRVLAAIVPVGDDTWFIKVTGRNDDILPVEKTFDALIASLEFPQGKKDALSMGWKKPEGWTEDRTKPNRVATLTPLGKDKPEITITKLGEGAAVVKPNVDRWRRLDLGLPAISPRALERVVREQRVRGRAVTIVDMRGPGGKGMTPAPAGRPPMPRDKRPEGNAPLRYKVPEGWRESAGGGGMTVAVLSVTDGGETAQLKVTPLSKSMPGGLKANVDRWRQEVAEYLSFYRTMIGSHQTKAWVKAII